MYLSNIDTLQFSLDFKDYDNSISNYLEALESKKLLAQEYRSNYDSAKPIIEINGFYFEVLPNGSKGYAYILHNSDFEIDFAICRSSNDDNYPVFVRIKQAVLWSLTIKEAYSIICNWLIEFLGNIKSEKINRVDLCCHTDCIDFSKYDYTYFRTRATNKNIRLHGSTVNGFEFGSRSGLIFCRIYNKTLEVSEKKSSTWFFDVWEEQQANTANVWNVEFELKRDFLREYNIETVNDMLKQAQSIWHYLTSKWLVLTEKNCTRLENCETVKEWAQFSNAFTSFGNVQFIRKDKQMLADKKTLVSQICGYIRSYAALENNVDLYSVFETLFADISEYLNDSKKDFESLVLDKAKLYVRGGV